VSARVLATAVLAIASLTAVPPAGAQTKASADALERWITAVKTHVPGHADAAARLMAGLSYNDRLQLNPAMELFFKALRGEDVPIRSDPQRQIADLFRSVRTQPGLIGFISRAAVLHGDAAIFADRFGPPPDDAPPPPTPRPGRRVDPPPPLLWSERYTSHTDGRVVGDEPANWNWPFARSLLDLFFLEGTRHDPGIATDDDRRFAAEWYHAVAAYMMAAGNLGDLRGHLQHAAELMPDDARVEFDRACFAEALGLPYNQTLRDDPGFARTGVELPSAEKVDSAAERLFRRALEIDPWFVEARVRLARLLNHRGQHEEAAAEIARALDAKMAGAIGFYAHIFAGRIASARGRYDEALQQYRAASALFPDAQSARLGASQAALMAADVPAALAPLELLGTGVLTLTDDPWWQYKLGAGRDVDPLMAHLWTAVTSR
jgi:tetratricopeptide (TPR) repeat protein